MTEAVNTDIIRMLFETCDTYPDNVALRFKKTSITYGELKINVSAVATNLRTQGLVEGDRVLFSIRPNLEGITLALGIVAAGGSCVFADLGTSEELFEARIKLVEPKFAATEGLLYALSHGVLRKLAANRGLNMPDYAQLNVQHFYSGKILGKIGAPKNAKSLRVLTTPTTTVYTPPVNPYGESMVVFTSGTTGNPKSVRHSRQDIGAGVHEMIKASEITSTSKLYSDHFMFGIAGLIAGSEWEIPDVNASEKTEQFINGMMELQATHTFLIPLDLVRVVEHVERTKNDVYPIVLPDLQVVASGAAPVLPSLIKKTLHALPNIKLLAVYGMTEILPVAMVDAKEKLEYSEQGDYLGRISEHVKIKIVDDEIFVSGAGLMLGYLGSDNIGGATQGWHPTGDLGRLNTDGTLTFLGRKKDMLIRGNTNIYPSLYEPSMSRVDGVKECAVIGVPDMYGDDVVVLVIAVTNEHSESDNVKDISHIIDNRKMLNMLRKPVKEIFSHDSLPDVVVLVNKMPLGGRSHKLDRMFLREVFLPKTHAVRHFLDTKYVNVNN